MNGKIKKYSLFALLSVFILVQTSIPTFADTIIPTDIPNYENPSYNINEVEEIAVLGTLAEMLNTGSAFDFADYNNSYSDFIDNINSMIPESTWSSVWNKIASQIDDEVNQIPVIGWINSALTGRSTFYAPANKVGQYIGTNWRFRTDDEDEIPEVNPDSNYSYYIEKSQTWYNGSANAWQDRVYNSDYDWINRQEYTYMVNPSNHWGGGQYDTFTAFQYATININLVENAEYDNTYMITCSNSTYAYPFVYNNNGYNSAKFLVESPTNVIYYYSIGNQNYVLTDFFPYTITGLDNALNYVTQHIKNFDLYVNGTPWIMNSTPTTSKIYYDDESLKYTDTDLHITVDYPDGTYFDYNQMKQIIQDIIDNKDVLTYNDIKPVFIDSNGQQAVAVYIVNQNPTDIDIDIQYPNGTPNFDSFTESFNEISNNTSPAVYLIELVAMVLPNELWELLIFGGVLFLFVFLIKRMLE